MQPPDEEWLWEVESALTVLCRRGDYEFEVEVTLVDGGEE